MKKNRKVNTFFVYAVMNGMLEHAKIVAKSHGLDDICEACTTAQNELNGARNKVKQELRKNPKKLETIDSSAWNTVNDAIEYLNKNEGNKNDKNACDYILTSISILLTHASDVMENKAKNGTIDAVCKNAASKLDVMELSGDNYDRYKHCIDKGFGALSILNDQRQQVYS